MVQKILNGTWSGHLVGAPGRKTSYQHESSGSGGVSSRLPSPQTGNMITLTHSHTRTHTPKDIIRTQKINLLGKKTAQDARAQRRRPPTRADDPTARRPGVAAVDADANRRPARGAVANPIGPEGQARR